MRDVAEELAKPHTASAKKGAWKLARQLTRGEDRERSGAPARGRWRRGDASARRHFFSAGRASLFWIGLATDTNYV